MSALVAEHAGAVLATAMLSFVMDPMFGDRPFALLENVAVVLPGKFRLAQTERRSAFGTVQSHGDLHAGTFV